MEGEDVKKADNNGKMPDIEFPNGDRVNAKAAQNIPRLFLEADNTTGGRIIRLNNPNKYSKQNDKLGSHASPPASSCHCKNEEYLTVILVDNGETSQESFASNASLYFADPVDIQDNESKSPMYGRNHNGVVFTLDEDSDTSLAENDDNDCQISLLENSHEELPPPPTYDMVCPKTLHKVDCNETLMSSDETQPPAYNDVADAPPDYHTLFAKPMSSILNIASNGGRDCLKDCCYEFFKATFILVALSCTVCLLITGFLILPGMMIAVGIGNIHYCPAQPRIPIFLISLGVFQLLEMSVRLIYAVLTRRAHRNQERQSIYSLKDPFLYFIVVWFVVGSMWAYKTYPTCYSIKDIIGSYWHHDDAIGRDIKITLVNDKRLHITELPSLTRNTDFTVLNNSFHSTSNVWTTRDNLPVNITHFHPPPKLPLSTKKNPLISVHKRKNVTIKTSGSISTTVRPSRKFKPLCCARSVYLLTFVVVTLYYSILACFVFLHFYICIRNMCRSRRYRARIDEV